MDDVPDFGPPPPSPRVQADALRTAFPQYAVNLITTGGKTLFEAVARPGTDANPYCLISSDVHEIWRELKAAALRPAPQLHAN
jgi:hypothetical protein